MLSIDKTVMLLVDVQGQLAQLMYKKEALFKSLEIIVQGMNILNIPIIWMEQIPKNLGPTTEQISRHLSGLNPIEKFSFSCCGEPKFVDSFDSLGRTHVLLTGIETHICVFQTGMELLNQGHEVHLLSDCVSSRTKENKRVGIQRLLSSGAQLSCVEMALFELMRAAEGDAFKQIIKLIK